MNYYNVIHLGLPRSHIHFMSNTLLYKGMTAEEIRGLLKWAEKRGLVTYPPPFPTPVKPPDGKYGWPSKKRRGRPPGREVAA